MIPLRRFKDDTVLRSAWLLVISILSIFVVLRLLLYVSPNSDFYVGSYNIHHLFTGLIFITAGGVPLAVYRGEGRLANLAIVLFGLGLGMALDEWVYLTVTPGTNADYLLPVSFWGGVAAIGLACIYVVILVLLLRRKRHRP
ncbi:MAG: hypothetical protein V3S70_02905 [Gammaproteobacteria bacterium]